MTSYLLFPKCGAKVMLNFESCNIWSKKMKEKYRFSSFNRFRRNFNTIKEYFTPRTPTTFPSKKLLSHEKRSRFQSVYSHRQLQCGITNLKHVLYNTSTLPLLQPLFYCAQSMCWPRTVNTLTTHRQTFDCAWSNFWPNKRSKRSMYVNDFRWLHSALFIAVVDWVKLYF